jgi:hypothetical protein
LFLMRPGCRGAPDIRGPLHRTVTAPRLHLAIAAGLALVKLVTTTGMLVHVWEEWDPGWDWCARGWVGVEWGRGRLPR